MGKGKATPMGRPSSIQLDPCNATVCELAERKDLQVVVTVAARGTPPRERVRDLLDRCQARHDILHCVIERNKKDEVFLRVVPVEKCWKIGLEVVSVSSSSKLPDNSPAGSTVGGGGTVANVMEQSKWRGHVRVTYAQERWIQEAFQLNQDWLDESGPLARMRIVQYHEHNISYYLMTFHHAIADAAVIQRIFEELALDNLKQYWRETNACTAEQAASLPDLEETWLPDPATLGAPAELKTCRGTCFSLSKMVLTAASNTFATQIPKVPRALRGRPLATPQEPYVEDLRVLQLSSTLTDHIRTTARGRGTNIWGLLNATAHAAAYEKVLELGIIKEGSKCFGGRRKNHVVSTCEVSMRTLAQKPMSVTTQRGMGQWAMQVIWDLDVWRCNTADDIWELAKYAKERFYDHTCRKHKQPWVQMRLGEVMNKLLCGPTRMMKLMSPLSIASLVTFNNYGALKHLLDWSSFTSPVEGLYWFGGGHRPYIAGYLECYAVTIGTPRGNELCITLHNNSHRLTRQQFSEVCDRFLELLLLAAGE